MKTKHHLSLSVKLNLFIIAVILLVSAGLVWISYRVYSDKINSIYVQQVERAARAGRADILPEYVEHFWNMINTDDFRQMRSAAIAANDENMVREWMLSKPSLFQDVDEDFPALLNPDEEQPEDSGLVETLTLCNDFEMLSDWLQECMMLFDITAVYIQYSENGTTYNLVDPTENLLYIGSIEDPIEEFASYADNEYIPATIYHSSYGWLCSATMPLYETMEGKIVGTIGADTDMEQVVRSSRMFLVNSAIYVIAQTLIAILVSVFLMRRLAVEPLRELAQAATGFAKNDKDNLTMSDVIELPITSNDEIGDLYREIRSMQTRIVDYTNHMTQITADRERVNTELNMARRIQRDMIPAIFPAFPEHSEFDLFAMMDPAREVGGDFYDFFLLDESHLAVLIADVSDKGVPAALFMMSSMIMIRYRSGKGGSPAEILGEVNKLICSSSKSKMFVTVWMGILDLETGIMTCANAGHEYPFVRGADGIFHMLKDKHGLVVGGLPTSVYRDYELKLEPGDAIFVYTDGVPEANDPDTQLFGMDRLEKTLNRKPEASPREILDNVRADVDEFVRGAKQFDDLTMLCLEYKGSAEPESADDPA